MIKHNFVMGVKRIALTLGLVLMFFYSVGCTDLENKNSQLPTPFTSVPTPDYLMMVVPTTTSQENYDKSLVSTFTMARGIVVEVNGNKIGLAPENRNVEVIQQRASLFVDDQQISRDTLIIADGIVGNGGPYYLSWAPSLMPGIHYVHFQFLTDAGEILEYSWQIVIEE